MLMWKISIAAAEKELLNILVNMVKEHKEGRKEGSDLVYLEKCSALVL